MILVVLGIAAIAFVLLLAIALCRVAAQADQRIERRHERLTENARLSEYRARHEIRNGIGGRTL